VSVLDIALGAVLAISVIYGLWRGFVHIALGVAGFGFGLAAALRLAERGPEWFRGVSPGAARVAAFAAVMVATLLVTWLVIWLGGRLIRAAGIGWMDRLAGAVIGFGGGLLVVLGILLGLATFLPAGSPLLRQSRVVPAALGAVDIAAAILPPGLAESYHRQREALSRLVANEAR
jgi:membrane protein required for colicin V production